VSHDQRADVSGSIATALRILTDPLPSPTSDLPAARALGAESPPMRQLMAIAARVAPTDSTVLISGESGVGKERLARWLHGASLRTHGTFVAVNCGAFADTVLESELFGHVRGAFTGALHDRLGVFEAAHGGTLFLDEIGEVSTAMQVKLLRVIQEREVMRLGETNTRPVDVRLIAATNRDLSHEVAQQRFRQDLYYRLRVIDVHVPPLRERPEDLRRLADTFLAQAATRLRRPVVAFAPLALERILYYEWPGNIRELEHAIERACAVAAGSRIEMDDLPASVRHAPLSRERAPDVRPLRDREREHILAVMERHHGDRRRTMEELRISLSTLKRRLRGYGRSA
jgi:two-component system, NtrC family, response regulator HydG